MINAQSVGKVRLNGIIVKISQSHHYTAVSSYLTHRVMWCTGFIFTLSFCVFLLIIYNFVKSEVFSTLQCKNYDKNIFSDYLSTKTCFWLRTPILTLKTLPYILFFPVRWLMFSFYNYLKWPPTVQTLVGVAFAEYSLCVTGKSVKQGV